MRSSAGLTEIVIDGEDEKAKFVDKLSAIGGTMGLLTGFSLISAVEIVYFFSASRHLQASERKTSSKYMNCYVSFEF